MKNSLISFLKQKVWGTSPSYASSETPMDRILEVYLQSTNGQRSLVGRLSYEQDEFVFRYDSDYEGNPISAFPRTTGEYRSGSLWPFFTTRIPPLDRADMKREILKRSLREDQVIEILGSVAKVSATNPYELKLVDGVT